MNKIPLAESALNRLLNFMDELDAPAVQGAAIDAALMQPTGDMPAVQGIDSAIVAKGLGLDSGG